MMVAACVATCTKCKQTKPATKDYFPKKKGKKNGLDSWCRECHNAEARRTKWRRYRGMVDDATVAALLAELPGCTICGARLPLVVDHCHDSNAFRGMLCQKCNIGLGHFSDDPELLEFAAEYLREMG